MNALSAVVREAVGPDNAVCGHRRGRAGSRPDAAAHHGAPRPRPREVPGEKQIVYCAFSRDESLMGFAFPKEERDALVAAEPAVYLLPGT